MEWHVDFPTMTGNDIAQIFTATGVIITAISSIVNRVKLGRVDKKIDVIVVRAEEVTLAAAKQLSAAVSKIDRVSVKADEAKVAAKTASNAVETAHAATIEALHEVKDAAIAVNAEVIKEMRNGQNGKH